MEKTYGRVSLEDANSVWRMSAQAHVVMMAKRIFTGAVNHRSGELRISVTDESCRLLHWFLQLYALECPDRDYLESRVQAVRERLERLEQIIQPTHVPREFSLAIPARDYQRTAADLYLAARSQLLGDSLGLGKSCTAICGFCDPATLPALVVSPVHLLRQWNKEINRFLPDLNVHILKGTKAYELDTKNPPDVLISTYHRLHGWDDALNGYLKSVVFDECQELRRADSAKYRAAKRIADYCTYRQGLSATPIHNYGGEIYNILWILAPDLVGTDVEFEREWCRKHGMHTLLKDPRAFNSWMTDQKIFIRRTREDVERELPPLTKIVYPLEADVGALEQIQGTAGELARIILSDERLAGFTKMQAAGEFDMLVRQATGIAKAPHIAAFTEILLESGEPVVLFVWHRAVHDILRERLAKYHPKFYTGAESESQKDASLRAFTGGETNLLIVSLRSGAGIDGLQHRCKTVVIGELDWSPAVMTQDIGRVDRDGQKHPVTAYILVSESGSDPVISEMLGLKREQSDGLLAIEHDVLAVQTDQSAALKKLAEEYLKKRTRVAEDVLS